MFSVNNNGFLLKQLANKFQDIHFPKGSKCELFATLMGPPLN